MDGVTHTKQLLNLLCIVYIVFSCQIQLMFIGIARILNINIVFSGNIHLFFFIDVAYILV